MEFDELRIGTTWADVYGATVTNGETISISGKARNGSTDISETYTITNKLTDTIDGLLTKIEQAYSAQGTTVNAFIRDGMIYVERTAEGRTRRGLMLCLDLEQYDYAAGSHGAEDYAALAAELAQAAAGGRVSGRLVA